MNGNNRKRKNWTLSLSIAVGVALAAAVIGCMGGQPTGQADRIYLSATAGSVLFDHGTHQENADSCVSCHHDLLSAELTSTCADCHDDDRTSDNFEHAELKEFHERNCVTCHESTNDREPVSCRDCHNKAQASEIRTVTCQECHDDSFGPAIMSHDEYQEIEDHSCVGCHNPATVSEVYHTNCTGCHTVNAPERFLDESGAPVCASCHLR